MMKMKYKKKLLPLGNTYRCSVSKGLGKVFYIMLCTLITACGGSGGSDSEGGSTQGLQNDVNVVAEPPAPVVASTADLIVPDDFQLQTDDVLTIKFDLGVQQDIVHLSICHPLDNSPSITAVADYENCLLRTWVKRENLNDAVFIEQIQLMSHIDTLVAVIFNPELLQESSAYWVREEGMDFIL